MASLSTSEKPMQHTTLDDAEFNLNFTSVSQNTADLLVILTNYEKSEFFYPDFHTFSNLRELWGALPTYEEF